MDALERIGIIPSDKPDVVVDTDDQFRKVSSAAEEKTEVVIEPVR